MSKAFTKEDAVEAPVVPHRRAPLPSDVPNYVTVSGLAALRAELAELVQRRVGLGSAEFDAQQAQRLLVLDGRIAELELRLGSAELVNQDPLQHDEVRFGARVTVRVGSGDARSYRIVGVDEADASHGRVAFVAPLARALLGKRVGEVALVRTPRGEDEVEVIAIEYGSFA